MKAGEVRSRRDKMNGMRGYLYPFIPKLTVNWLSSGDSEQSTGDSALVRTPDKTLQKTPMSGDSGEISGNSELSAISTPKLSQVFV
jgi:hypothetical protein